MTGTHAAPVEPPATAPKRWRTLDVFRATAIISMIQGHVFTAVLRPDAYQGSWARWHLLIHGLTAPMFLIGAGLAYGIVSFRGGPDGLTRRLNRRIVKRSVVLLVLGVVLQFPRVPLHIAMANRDLLVRALAVGPLQLVGACLLVAEALRVSAGSLRRATHLAAGMVACVAGMAPYAWRLRASQGPAFALGTWLDGYGGSLFPWFPWAAFFFLGLVMSAAVMRPWVRRSRLNLVFATGGAVLAGGAYWLYRRGIVLRSLYGDHELWHTNPLYVAFRAGLVSAWLGLLGFLEPHLVRLFAKLTWLERVVSALARGSLVAYVAHLLLLFGTPFTAGLARAGKTLSLPHAALMFALLLALTTAVTMLWERYVTDGVLARAVCTLGCAALSRRVQVDRVGESKRLDIGLE